MATVEIRGLDTLINGLGQLQSNHLPFALAKTLTNLASIARDNTIEEMRRVFDKPTPYAINSLAVKMATKTNLQSKVQLKDNTRIGDQNHYLNPEVTGGKRGFKPFEAVVTGTESSTSFIRPVLSASAAMLPSLNTSIIGVNKPVPSSKKNP